MITDINRKERKGLRRGRKGGLLCD